jgi:hypothetical protein
VKSACIFAVVLCLAGCSKNIDTPEAVKEGVLKDVAKKVDINAMEVSVDSVSFREKEATAQVSFRPKGAPPGSQAITFNYALERDGDQWRIKNRNMQGHEMQQPAGSSQMPPGHSITGSGDGQQLPPGHPTTGTGNGQQMPPGHPQVSPGTQK